MSVKKPTANCPNCGAPIKSLPTFGHSQWCEYCGTLVDMSPYMPKPNALSQTNRPSETVRVEKQIVYVPTAFSPKPQSAKARRWIKRDDDGRMPPEEWWKIGLVVVVVLAPFLWAVSVLL